MKSGFKMNNYKLFDFSEDQKNFLKAYSPKDNMFTSKLEMKEIYDVFNLKNYSNTEIVRSIRNSVVMFYNALSYITDDNGEIIGRTDDFWTFNTSMMSVTAVIDNYMFSLDPYSV